jgi:hypothetical protein
MVLIFSIVLAFREIEASRRLNMFGAVPVGVQKELGILMRSNVGAFHGGKIIELHFLVQQSNLA